MTALDVVLPLASVLLGAAITYVLNVRTRRRTRVEDIFHEAIAAVTAAAASVDYTSSVAPWQGATAEAHRALLSEMNATAVRTHLAAVAVARAAVARASAYRSELRDYLTEPTNLVPEADAVIAALHQALRG